MVEQLGVSVSIDAEMARFERAMQDAGRLVETTTSGMDRQTKRAAQAFSKLEGALDPAGRALTRLERDTIKVQQALDRGAVTAERAAALQKRLNDQYEATVTRLNTVSAAQTTTVVAANKVTAAVVRNETMLGRLTASAGGAGGAMQQLGFQVGDVAAQVASGGNFFAAAGIQVGQFIGAFGPIGAVVGAAATIGGALAASMMDTADNTKEAKKALQAYEDAIDTSNAAMMTSTELSRSLAREKANEAAETLKAAMATEVDTLAKRQQALELQRQMADEARERNQFLPNQNPDAYMREPMQQTLDAILQSELRIADLQKRIDALTNPAKGTALGEDLFGKPGKDADEFAKKLESLTDSLDPVGAATRKFREDMATLTKAGKENSELADELIRRYGEDLTKAYEAVEGEAGKYREVLTETTERMGLENDVLRLQVSGREEQAAWLQEEARLRDQLGPLYDQNAGQLRTLWEENRRLSESYKDQQEAAKEAQKEIERQIREQESMVNGIVRYGADELTDGLFDGTRKGWQDMLDGMLADLGKFFVRAAAEAALRPIAVTLVGRLTGSTALSGSGAGGGSGVGLSNLSDIGSILRGGNGTGSLMPGVDSWAQSTFGWGQIGLSSVGAAGMGAVGGGAAANLGVAAVPGGITNAAATAPGLLNGGSMTAGFGSLSNVLGIGGAILPGLLSGNYAQAAAGGIGAAIGTAILPGIGTAIGGMLGNLAGSLLGGKKNPHPAFHTAYGAVDGSFGYIGGSQKHLDDAMLKETAEPVVEAMRKALAGLLPGATVTGATQFALAYDQKKQNWSVHDSAGKLADFGQDQAAAVADLIFRSLKNADYEGLADDVATALKNSLSTDLEGLAADINFAQTFRTIFDRVDPIGPFETTLRQLEAAFAAAEAKAEELGLEVDDMAASFRGATQRLAEDINRQMGLDILDMIDPTTAALYRAQESLNALRKDVEAVGGDMGLFDRYQALVLMRVVEGEQIAAQTRTLEASIGTWDRLGRTLRQTRLALLLDDTLSPLDPRSRLDEAQRQYDDVARRARLGDVSALEQLPEISRQYLEVARGFYASSEDYARIFNAVSATLQDTESLAARHLNLAQQQLGELQAVNANLATLHAALQAIGQNPTRDYGAAPDLNRQIASVLPGFTGNFGQGALNSYMQGASQAERNQVNAILEQHGIQGRFAKGGDFGGGLRLVGEEGPELEVTGPSRIFNAQKTQEILRGAMSGSDNADVVKELRATNRILMTGLTAVQEELAATRAELADVRAKLGRAA